MATTAALQRRGAPAGVVRPGRGQLLHATSPRPHATAPSWPLSCLTPRSAARGLRGEQRRCGSGNGSTEQPSAREQAPSSSSGGPGGQQAGGGAAASAPPPGEQPSPAPAGGDADEDQSWTPEVATLFLNFCIVFVLVFFVPSALPGDLAKSLGLGSIAIGSAVVAAAVAFLTMPPKQGR
jgi:hypothetical protein